MYKINNNIPGWNSPEILEKISHYAAQVKEWGNILELGALFGRTTYSLGHNKKPTVKLWVIDLWGTHYLRDFVDHYLHDGRCSRSESELIESLIVQGPPRLPGDAIFKLWKNYTQDIPNISPHRRWTSQPNSDFPMMDLIIHDAGHSYEDVRTDLQHWLPKLAPGGLVVVDDYEPTQFPGVIQAVDEIVAEFALGTEMITSRNILLYR